MKIVHQVAVYIPCIFLVCLTACYQSLPEQTSQALYVVCTTGMITDAVRAIGGDQVTTIGLMGPGVDPHLYRARPSDMYNISRADIIFYNGLHLEGKMVDIFQQLGHEKPCIALGDTLPVETLLMAGFEGVYDPHIWHDIALWVQVVQVIIDTLCAYDKPHAQLYQLRGQAYVHQLQETDRYMRNRVQEIPQEKRILVTAHDAFSYFGRAYGFRVIGLQGISTDVQIGIQDIQALVDTIIEHHIPVMFIESSVIARNLQAVQQAAAFKGHTVTLMSSLYSDALGDDASHAATYCTMMRKNIDTIVDALTKKVYAY